MKKALLILAGSVFVLAGCQDEAPSEPIGKAPAEQASENVTVTVTEGIQTIQSAATSTLRPETEQTEQPRLTHTARNSLDWEGPYFGTLPCADCSGIATTLTLNFDGTYSYDQTYLGKGEEGEYKSTGEFVWNSKGDTITLSKEDDSQQFFVAENALMMLDVDGNKVEGEMADNYTLVQQE
ncbi:copper resistance protein NlpE [Vibrio rhodolitus]|uniref:copper resistance protein NlpE n=1 Tax=Vibrio rhodolitus TaxID=2231649 RepID=UPI000E0B3DA5|nr:copper resistance protein NlpE [Vibrio rhodolitus]